MITAFISALLLFSSPELSTARDLFFASSSEEMNEKFVQSTSKVSLQNNPVVYAYNGLAVMKQAEHTFNPYSKLKYFEKGKDKIEEAVKHSSQNAEIRFVRLCAQKNLPSFLGYSSNIQSDLEQVKKAIKSKNFSNDNSFTKNVVMFMASNGWITPEEEKEFLKLF